MHRALWGILCVLCISAPLAAAEVLTLDDVVARALEYSITLQKSRIDLEDQEYSSNRLWALIFPRISPSVGLSYANSPVFSTGASGSQSSSNTLSYSTSAGISLDFTAGIPYQMRILSLAYQQQLLTYEDTQRQLEITVAKSFYTLIADEENLAQLAESLTLAERQLEKNRTARANGFVSEMVLLQSQLAVETAKYNLSTAQADHVNQLGVFLTSLGLDPQTPVTLKGDFNIRQLKEDPEQLIREYLPDRPDIKRQRQLIQQRELSEKQKLFDARAPSLGLSFNWSGSGGLVNNDSPFSDRVSGSVTLSIPVNPWIPGTTQSQSLRTARSDTEKALLDLRNTEDTAAAQIRSLTASLQNSWDSLEIARLREQIAQRSYELTERGFLAGTVESLTLEDSRNSLASARYQLLRSELNYQNLVLDLARAINVDWRQFMRSTP